ncbi:carboxyl-terminal processing protease [Amycolatopsis pretoriensis]|uniref:Carboxyl-terminal processing protease n=1 Tax=Amycolatopsis pretoriensis TaxID=218821 RepID=A0A1H5R4G8_9PSEU|nr:S41 family peptidase [Amycolatopsis pretoriensis]SEF32297.1 carboxyl-terminal processing protease [Amycolatopsis pretoriensis]
MTNTRRKWAPLAGGLATLAVSATMIGFGVTTVDAAESGGRGADRPPACAELTPPAPGEDPQPVPAAPTSVTTVGQVYYCILDHHYSGPVLDPRSLLSAAFAAMTQEMQRRGIDQADATLPGLTGKRDADWTAFRRVYQGFAAKLPDDAAREAVAATAVTAMLQSLNDNHAEWRNSYHVNTTGLGISAVNGPGKLDAAATDPLYVTTVVPGSPAEQAGLKLGDEIRSVNGVPPYVNGVLSQGVVNWLTGDTPVGTRLEITLHRPVTDATVTTTMTAAEVQQSDRKVVESALVGTDIAKVTMHAFAPGAADEVLAAIKALRANATLRGVVLDLRGNSGGRLEDVGKLLGAWASDQVFAYMCDVKDHCTPSRTDKGVEQVGLPLVVLTDRRCASACDAFAGGVKDLGIGTLVGTRTAGIASGPQVAYQLDDGSTLVLTGLHGFGANKELINTIGVAPDHIAPVTAADLSAGRDPGLAKAVALLG